MSIELETEYLRYVVGNDGRNLQFIDKRTGTEYCTQEPGTPFAKLRVDGREHEPSSAEIRNGLIELRFGDSQASVALKVEERRHYLVVEVVEIDGVIEELEFGNLQLSLEGKPEESFAACAVALNLQTNVAEIPGPNNRLRAICLSKFGLVGANAAFIGCPQDQLRDVLKEVLREAEYLPHSEISGPWAMDGNINYGSYLFDTGKVSEETIDDWIRLVKRVGFNQLDFHGGTSFRFGDCEPNRELYPRGLDSLKAVVDKLHDAGIAAGLHTYAFFINKQCPWVTPVPDSRLATDATFTLSETLQEDAHTVPVVESTEKMSNITGFFVRNSVTLRIDDELITYKEVQKEPPYAFTDCERGACGTKSGRHDKGAEVHHLKECFGLLVPDPDTTLLVEVAARTAEAYNTCGFDMMYLDALDGEDILGGQEYGWHYGSRFVFELWKRLDKPALMEMSTFHHHLWPVRGRMGAWDHPNRSHKKFIDIHCEQNEECNRMFLPANLGWWAVKTWKDQQGEPTYPDDIEYLCCKAIGTNSGLSLMGVDPKNIETDPALSRLADIFRRYEDLRHSNSVSDSMKSRLRTAGEEFTMVETETGDVRLQPIQYEKHKVLGLNGWSNVWTSHNKFGEQPAGFRIEALMSAGPYEDESNDILAEFDDVSEFNIRDAEKGIQAELKSSTDQHLVNPVSGHLRATSRASSREGSWVKFAKVFSPPIDLSEQQGLGVWVYGDGKGELLNFQVQSPEHLTRAFGEHYVIVDFTGWRYFELIEPEGERYDDYSWPYGWLYHIYREDVRYDRTESLSIWLNHLPPNDTVNLYLSPIKALPLISTELRNPAITIGERTIVFPIEMEIGSYLEFRSKDDCKLYGSDGKLLCEIEPKGNIPILQPGDNEITFKCDPEENVHSRARVQVIGKG